ncbi:O-methyltransferase [Streptomonospora salina]|uniref:Caffeoyl-CoA O-methyltransferase n=1 Tax=Streptomonospora salina TaxID=104205 RepID=A0A841DZI8_9ACTN|nr:class I SAM-dependent methyltransferase [Streptomonospora salina]MBB5996897.1 caffeoyl-CoA O-methyltransferase [Streptomonospora salina]
MTRTSESVTPQLHDYLVAHSAPVDPVLADLAEETARRYPDQTTMQIGAEQGTFMTLLARIGGARDVVEVGTFTGYSAICMARGIPADGSLLALDVSEEWTALARRYWQRAGVADKIELRLAPALETLRALPGDRRFDLAFIDADKEGYIGYWEELVPRMRPGGVLLVDNTLSHGRVIDPAETSAPVQGIRDFNDHALADERVEPVLLPVGDGLTMARVRG